MLSRLMIIVASAVLTSCQESSAIPQVPTSIFPLSPDRVSSYAPFTHFAGAAFCDPSLIQSWSCGVHCEANPSFKLFDRGGDGYKIPYWFVGYDPDHDMAIVAHQGTNVTHILSILTDLKVTVTGLDPVLFPGVPSAVKVHNGFAKAQAQTASLILSAVQDVIDEFGTSTVTTVGHSLGAALSLIDSVYLRLHMSTDITVMAIVYGLPRVGNQAWANFIDAQLVDSVTHVNNKRDPVPILPGRFLGYHHPSGEIHIDTSNAWYVCPGQDNTSKLCTVGAVPSLVFSNSKDHDGPYDGVSMPCNPSISGT